MSSELPSVDARASPDSPLEPRPPAGLRVRRRTIIAFGILACLASGGFAVTSRSTDAEQAASRARTADQAAGALRATLAATRSDVRGLVGVFSTARAIDDFSQFATPALQNRALASLAWAPGVTAAMRSSFEGERGFSINELAGKGTRRAGTRDTYFPVLYAAPSGTSLRAIGVDLASQPAVRAAIEASLETGLGRATAPVDLIAGGRGLLLVEPAFRRGAPIGTAEERRAALTGFAVGTVVPETLAKEALAGSGVRIAITDGGSGASLYAAGAVSSSALVRSIDAGGRTWRIAVQAEDSASAAALPWLVLVAGMIVAALIALMIEQNARRLVFAEDLVARRTVELREALAMLNDANSSLDAARADAERKSQVDALTETYNRGHVIELLKVELNRAERGDSTPALILVDLDDFKALNDEFGPTAGDVVLVEIAQRLKAMLRSYDSLGRFANKQFAVLAPNVAGDDALFRVADAIRRVVCSGPVLVDGREVWPTVSVGAARAGETFDAFALISAADAALGRARVEGRNATSIASDGATPHHRPEPDAIRIAQALAKSVADREGMPEHHNKQVADLAAAIARRLGLDEEDVLRVKLGGWLHDVGKVAIPEQILSKPDPLDDDEWEVMRSHTTIGEEIVARIEALAAAGPAVRHHHERYDGSGYPDQLAGDAIPLEARIVAVADSFSAMTADPPFRRSRGTASALREIQACVTTHYDPAVVDALVAELEAPAGDGGGPATASATV